MFSCYTALMKVTIIGGGKIGSALAKIIETAVTSTSVWDIDSKKIRGESELSAAVAEADLLFLCIPSWAHFEVLQNLKPILQKNTQIVSLAKGMVMFGAKPMLIFELLQANLPAGQGFAVLSGPMIAEDLALGKPCSAVLASESKFGIAKLAPLFHKTNLQLEQSDDLVGVCLAGVLKNVYTLAVGTVEGAGFADRSLRVLKEMCLDEMLRVGVRLGAKAKTMKGLAGREDFLITVESKFSHNRRAGMEIGQYGSTELRSEGMASLEAIAKRLGKAEDAPIFSALRDIVNQLTTAREAFKDILR